MKVLILGAGDATRLYPFTLTQPKPLVAVAGRPMIDHVLEHLTPIPGIDHVYIATNHRFVTHFEKWADQARRQYPAIRFTIVDDGSTHESNRLGAIGDIDLVIQREKIDDDLIVVAGDNVFSESLAGFGTFCHQHGQVVLGVYDVGSLQLAQSFGVVETDAQGRVTLFQEKPADPASTLIGIALYYFPRSMLPRIREYLAAGHNPGPPGGLIQWLYPQVPVLAWHVPGVWYDIESKETLEEATRVFTRR